VKRPWQTTWRIGETDRWRSEQQAAALCRVDRVQVTRRASGVSCTAWLGGNLC